MKKISTLLSVLAAAILLSAGAAQAQIIDVSIVNDGSNTTLTFESTTTAPLANVSGTTSDGIDLLNFFAGNNTTIASNNAANAPGANGWNIVTPDLTSTFAVGTDSSAVYNGFYSDDLSGGINLNPDFNLLSVGTGTAGNQSFVTTGAAFTGTMTLVLNDSSYAGLISILPHLGVTQQVYTGWELSTNTSVTGAHGTDNVDIGTWQVVAFDDLPSQTGSGSGDGTGVGAAPEPRSWALAGIVALAILALCRMRLRTIERSDVVA